MSGDETVHYMHFMNWTTQVPGTFIGDHDRSQLKEILQTTIKHWSNRHDYFLVSGDTTYKSLWRENYVFATLLNPSQSLLCDNFKEDFLKFLFGNLEYTFKMNMEKISFNSTTMNGAFTFANDIELKGLNLV